MYLKVEVETVHYSSVQTIMRFTVTGLPDGKEHRWALAMDIDEILPTWDHVFDRASKLLKRAVQESMEKPGETHRSGMEAVDGAAMDGGERKGHLCTVCHSVPVDVANGFDTCPDCLRRV